MSGAGECEGDDDDDDHKDDEGFTSDGLIAASNFHYHHDSPDESHDCQRHGLYLGYCHSDDEEYCPTKIVSPWKRASRKLSLDWLRSLARRVTGRGRAKSRPASALRSSHNNSRGSGKKRSTSLEVVPSWLQCEISLPILHLNPTISTTQRIPTILSLSRRYRVFMYFILWSKLLVS